MPLPQRMKRGGTKMDKSDFNEKSVQDTGPLSLYANLSSRKKTSGEWDAIAGCFLKQMIK